MPTASSATSGGQKGHLEKFQELLRELFQFDCADLDFGIYRIMNHKRDVVERFIVEDLPKAVDEELSSGLLARQALARAKLEEAREKVVELLGRDALDLAGEVANPALAATPVAQDYLDWKARAGASRSREAVEADVYNHLTAFFSRYYEDGDFVSKRRYSRKHRYAIPYNGEEVHLHWANADQYYVKTAEHFHSYDWRAPTGVSVRFQVDEADVEQNNVKGERRFFLPRVARAEWDEDGRIVTLPFEYRPLNAQEKRSYGSKNQQDRILVSAAEAVLERLVPEASAALGRERRRNAKDEPVSHLEHHLRRYTRRNDSDFFIHKDLRGFLTRELDFYLKNEVLDLDELAAAGEFVGEGWFQVVELMRTIGAHIIDFLAQIEGFQKMLWQKRKFVVETNYCVAMKCVPLKLYGEVAANETQWEEWRALGMVGEEPETLFDSCETREERIVFLQTKPTLMLDTVHFQADFTDQLLAGLDNLDGTTDGVLVHSENWQALSLLREKHSRSVQCVYLDPPYNTGDSQILYKNGYLRSSWLSLMGDRLQRSSEFFAQDAVLYVAIDDFEVINLSKLVDAMLPTYRRDVIVVNHHPQGGKARTLAQTHEYMLVCTEEESARVLVGRSGSEEVEHRPFRRSGTARSNFRRGRKNSFFAVLVDPISSEVMGLEPPPEGPKGDYPLEPTKEGLRRIYPIGDRNEERVWRRSYESCKSLVETGKLICKNGSTIYQSIEAKDRNVALFSNWVDPRYNAGTWGANLLRDVMGEQNVFPYPKSVYTVEDAVFAAGTDAGDCVLDFFAGSGTTGHAVINLNREDGGGRKFILVEMGEYFDTVLLPRIKKVAFAPAWKDGRPSDEATVSEAERSPRLVKCVRLESYEEALDSIRFDDEAAQLRLEEKLEGYLLNYMLKWETKDSETLLNPAELASPFSYKLRVHENGSFVERTADVAETFNYLLGLHVRTRRVYLDGERRYLVFRGETRAAPGRTAVVIWRETDGWAEDDLAHDRDFIAAEGMAEGADALYVNGASSVPGARPIEPLFKSRMFAGVSDA